MKKKLFITFALLFSIFANTIAQTNDFKYYSNKNLGFEGYAFSTYKGNYKNRNISDKDFYEAFSSNIDDIIKPVEKLTKKNNWLFRQAINEYDYEKGEVYIVYCVESLSSTEYLMLFVYINGKDDFVWKAYIINEDIINNLDDLLDGNYGYNSSYISPIPSPYGECEIFDWYTSLGIIQTTTCDNPPSTVRVDIALAYKKDDKETLNEFYKKTVEIQDFLRSYFSSKTAEELKNPDNEEPMEYELRNAINDKILLNSKIRDVVFQQKDVIE